MEIMKRGLIQWLTAVGVGAVLTVSNLQAQTTPQATQEINGLLSFVERSDCLFVRNGTEYPAPQARQHLEKKLSYLENKNMVSSAEDFINLAASKSSISGKAYEVRCPSGTQPASTWLQTELRRLRQHQ